jgi:hypothetical protein
VRSLDLPDQSDEQIEEHAEVIWGRPMKTKWIARGYEEIRLKCCPQTLSERREVAEAMIRQKQEALTRAIRAIFNWARLVNQVESLKDPDRELMITLTKNISSEVKEWRSQTTWKYQEARALRQESFRPVPKLKAEWARDYWQKPWAQELKKYQEEDADVRRYHDELSARKFGEQKQQDQANLPKDLTLEAIWGEILALTKRSRLTWAKFERLEKLRADGDSRERTETPPGQMTDE